MWSQVNVAIRPMLKRDGQICILYMLFYVIFSKVLVVNYLKRLSLIPFATVV